MAYNATRQLLAWSELALSNSVYLASLSAPDRRIELKSDVPGLVPFLFSEDGNYLVARKVMESLRVWNVDHAPKPETRRVEKAVGRNDACPCGSGKKFKKCHGA